MKHSLKKLQCLRCDYEWYPRNEDVKLCPRCKSYVWWKPRKDNKGLRGGRDYSIWKERQ